MPIFDETSSLSSFSGIVKNFRFLGGGFTADVYKAELATADAASIPVVVKILRDEHTSNEELKRTLRIEAEDLLKLNDLVVNKSLTYRTIPRFYGTGSSMDCLMSSWNSSQGSILRITLNKRNA